MRDTMRNILMIRIIKYKLWIIDEKNDFAERFKIWAGYRSEK